MRKIGVTQRVEVSVHGERRDCLDQRWSPLLAALGLQVVPLPNVGQPAVHQFESLELDGLLLTGGNDLVATGSETASRERDEHEMALLGGALHRGLPILAICRGMQLVNLAFGGRLAKREGHVAVRHALDVRANRWGWPARLEVNSYHEYGIGPHDVGHGLRVVATDAEGGVEALEHEELPVAGVMWHPEREPALRDHDSMLLCTVLGGVPCEA